MKRAPGPHASRQEIDAWHAYLERQERLSDAIAWVIGVAAVVGAILSVLLR